MATTSKDGSRRENYPLLVRGGSNEKYIYGIQSRLRNSNEYNLNPLTRTNQKASLMPAAAVTPASKRKRNTRVKCLSPQNPIPI
ncbi:hypothetical protein Smp_095400 [Schistosoma mansoni]|uniref:Uncharacterized protein n=1 Tax=Schistosoma mansoni TaxID=6183 RepID=G4LZT3_SCHMA|nr:hypothetical protein Smp_095400 [Schistosoma mansoni]|eukprot:XP_018646751.1 hypothetical protein Smp_095400 [Schistosoma mansoni]